MLEVSLGQNSKDIAPPQFEAIYFSKNARNWFLKLDDIFTATGSSGLTETTLHRFNEVSLRVKKTSFHELICQLALLSTKIIM